MSNPTLFNVRSTTKLSQIIYAYFLRLGQSINTDQTFIVDSKNDMFNSCDTVDQCGFQNNDFLTIKS